MNILSNYRQQLNQKFGATADCCSENYRQGYEDGKKSSYRETPMKKFPHRYSLKI